MKLFQQLSLLVCLISISFSSVSFAENERKLVIDAQSTTKHITKIKGEKIKYSATTGTQPVGCRPSCDSLVIISL
ncbi:MAG: hypothetical protein COB83_00795 [Gammaproteobacteria bacterium]|nr:MAG: hypothetical protein COB83_00795 [Gammaproteobacteria bacterium]